jgi:hypothetical protein
VENLILQGNADLQGYGNGLSNALYGNSGNNPDGFRSSNPTTPARQTVSTNANVSALRGLSASSFAVLRQGKVRRGNSCLDVGIARCDGERRAQMEDDTLQEEGSRPHSFFLLRFGDPTL